MTPRVPHRLSVMSLFALFVCAGSVSAGAGLHQSSAAISLKGLSFAATFTATPTPGGAGGLGSCGGIEIDSGRAPMSASPAVSGWAFDSTVSIDVHRVASTGYPVIFAIPYVGLHNADGTTGMMTVATPRSSYPCMDTTTVAANTDMPAVIRFSPIPTATNTQTGYCGVARYTQSGDTYTLSITVGNPTNAPDQCTVAAAGLGPQLVLPSPTSTPGAVDPAVKQATIRKTICARGWTARVQPPPTFTSTLKQKQMRQYGETGSPSAYEEDHLIPLGLGGAPRDPRNLWPEPQTQALHSNPLETALQRRVCAGRLTLAAARRQIVAYKRVQG